MKKINAVITLLLCFSFLQSNAMNFLRPYDTLLRLEYTGKPWRIGLFAEGGLKSATGFNGNGNSVNPLRLYNCDQNALAMLKGFGEHCAIGQLNMRINANDDCVRGHFSVCGDFKMDFATALELGYFVTEHWGLSLYVPFFGMRLDNVLWCEQTRDIIAEDARVKRDLTNNFFENVASLGNGLCLQGWKRRGPGDMLALIHWHHVYPQYRPLLKQVQINGRVGLNLPSGQREDEDKIMALPFGYDGAVGILWGGGLDLQMGRYFKLGFDIELLHLFGNTRKRRIKTDLCQTELLLLQKVCAYKDFGITQRFNLYFQFHRFFKGASLLVGYQFFKHGDDELVLSTREFSSTIANTAESLQEWTMHQIMINLNYNFAHLIFDDSRIIPQGELYFRLPFDGKRVIVAPMVGVRFALDF